MNNTESVNETLSGESSLTENEVSINFYISILIFIVSNISIFFQSIILYIFLKKREILKNIAYKIQMNIGVSVLIQQIVFMITSVYGIVNKNMSYRFETILGAIVQGAFLSMISFISLLTFNAFDVFYDRRFFSSINRQKLFKYSLYVCYVWAIFVMAFYMIPNFSLKFSLNILGFRYRGDFDNYLIGFEVENKFVISFLTISFLIYIFIILKIYKTRKLGFGKTFKSTFYWSDVKFVIQTISNFLFYVVIELLWEYGEYILPRSRYSDLVINLWFILNSSNNIILVIIMIGEIRKEIGRMFLGKKNHKVTVILVPNNL